uniref:C2H2-type domain-containing protein n=1 Tax=Ornithorhynchus anatinus TaxID=9258 RepID=A0A6I8NHJ9_ORNAN
MSASTSVATDATAAPSSTSTSNATATTSTTTEEAKPTEKKIFYCEICHVPCMSSISLQSHFRGAKHKKKERALSYFGPATSRTFGVPRPALKRKFTKDIRSLKDLMYDPKREEPLIGLEHVVEIRFAGRKEPHYECKLCEFNTEMAPMIEHLSGFKHRKAYITKTFPKMIKTGTPFAKEDRVKYLRQLAQEVEKKEGLKMYMTEDYAKTSTSVSSCTQISGKKRTRWSSDFKPENDPVKKYMALKYMESFHITSEAQATLVKTVTQGLTKALKAFCEKQAAVNYASSLRPLMSLSRYELGSGYSSRLQTAYKDISGSSHIQEPYRKAPKLDHSQFAVHYPTSASYPSEKSLSYSSSRSQAHYHMGEGIAYYRQRFSDSETKSSQVNDPFLHHKGGYSSAHRDWRKSSDWHRRHMRHSLDHAPYPSPSSGECSMYSRCSGGGYSNYSKSDMYGCRSDEVRMPGGGPSRHRRGELSYSHSRNYSDERVSYSAPAVTYPSPRRYSTSYPLEGSSSSYYYSGESVRSSSPVRASTSWSTDARLRDSS